MSSGQYQVKLLAEYHNRELFCCGVKELDEYLICRARQDSRRRIAVTYVLTEFDSDVVMGFYSLSATNIRLTTLPNEISKKLPRYPFVPATLLGRLAVATKYQGSNLGGLLLMDALKRSLAVSAKIASSAVVVETKNRKAANFYKHYGFMQFSNRSNRLFLPMTVVKKL